jgi:hypothetical protein
MKRRLSLGEHVLPGSGYTRPCLVEIEVDLSDGRLSVCGTVWKPNRSDAFIGGQCADTLEAWLPEHPLLARIVPVWRRWHCNDMRAGDAMQEAFLRERPLPGVDGYAARCAALEGAGLLVHDGYWYGSAWVREELPAEVMAEVESWFALPACDGSGSSPSSLPSVGGGVRRRR